jgi:Zn finger protein HypA/HybF involved in hydrogenase expression
MPFFRVNAQVSEMEEYPRCRYGNPQAWHYLCPSCGELWAEVIADKPGEVKHQCIHRKCTQCGMGKLALWDDKYLKILPLAALSHELSVILNYENDYANYES